MIRAPRHTSSVDHDPGLILHRTVLLHAVEPHRQPHWHARASELVAVAICAALIGIVGARLLLG